MEDEEKNEWKNESRDAIMSIHLEMPNWRSLIIITNELRVQLARWFDYLTCRFENEE